MLKQPIRVVILAIVLVVLACSAPVGGSEPTTEPTLDETEPTTETAPTEEPTQESPTPTQADSAQSTGQPTAQPTSIPATAVPTTPTGEPIVFERGADRSFVEGSLPTGATDLYTLQVSAGQDAAFYLRSPETGLTMSVMGVVDEERENIRTWLGKFTDNGVVQIEVLAPDGFSGAYRLDVIILPVGTTPVDLTLAPAVICSMTFNADNTPVLYKPSPSSDVFSSALGAGETFEVQATTPDNAYYALDPGVAQAGNTGANRLRWVAAADVTLDGLCTWVNVISLADVEADIAFDQRVFCGMTFNVAQAYLMDADASSMALGSFLAGESTLGYAVDNGYIGVIPPEPLYGYYGLDRLVWINASEGDRTEDAECASLQGP